MALGRKPWVDVKQLPLFGHARGNGVVGNFGAEPLHRPDGIIDEFRPQFAEHGHVVRDDIAHSGQLADDADLHPAQLLHGARGGGKIRDKSGELPAFSAACEERAGNARAHQAVGIILRAVDALIDRQLPFLKIAADGLIRLHQRQRQRQSVVPHRARKILALRIAEHQDQNAVQSFGVVLRRQRLDRLAARGDARKRKFRCAGEGSQYLLRIAALAFHDAGEDRLVVPQHQCQHAKAWLAACLHKHTLSCSVLFAGSRAAGAGRCTVFSGVLSSCRASLLPALSAASACGV